jgi:hypothetical protein
MRAGGAIKKGAASATRRWREAQARPVVQAWRTSGLALSRFAADHGVSPSRLSRWARRLGTQQPVKPRELERGCASASGRKLRFHRVDLVGSERGHSDVIEVVLRDGRRVRLPAGFSAEDLGRVLEVLEQREQC